MPRPIGSDFSDFRQVTRALQVLGDGTQPAYNVAFLATLKPKAGTVVFATDALKVGETTGGGTGTIVYFDGSIWCRVGDDTEAEA